MSAIMAAWWELYVFALFQRLGFEVPSPWQATEVEVHPSVPGTGSKPDFRVSRGADGMYVECAATAGDDNLENVGKPGYANA
ncbi:MAG: hypothetical protein SV966_05780 [Actinomycetota bacterium]|nr:hypothetical protein [Actinomycetota bacterium]